MDHNDNINLSFHVGQQEIQNIKYFIFKKKQFPIDFDKLKKIQIIFIEIGKNSNK